MARKSRKHLDCLQPDVANTIITYKAAGYIRLSVEDNNKNSDSVETQKAIIKNCIELSSDIELHDFYIDNGITGTTFERPAFKNMLADTQNGVINCIIVKDLSRFGRSAIDTGYYIEKYLPSLACRFIAINDNFDTNTDMDNGTGIMLPLKNIINEAYALDISRKIKAQKHQAMITGEYIYAFSPYGYFKSPDDYHKLVIDPVTAPIVKQIFEWFNNEMTINQITKSLNQAKIITPSCYKKSIGLTKNNKQSNSFWQAHIIKNILKNEIYTGDMVQGKSQIIDKKIKHIDKSEWFRVPNTHQGIVSRDEFAKVQVRLQETFDKRKSRTKNPQQPNIYKSKIFCIHCGSPMSRSWYKLKNGIYKFRFRCLSNIHKTGDLAVSNIISEECLTEALLNTIKSHDDVIINKSFKLHKHFNIVETKVQSIKTDLFLIQQEVDNTRRMFKSLYENFVNNSITADEYRDLRSRYQITIQEKLKCITDLKEQQFNLKKQANQYLELSDILKNTNKNGITPILIDKLINKIQVRSDKSIEVEFKFTIGFEFINEVADNG